jgi:nucleoside-diphosphate kinase
MVENASCLSISGNYVNFNAINNKSLSKIMAKHPSKERTLILIKPDGIQRTLIGEIIGRYERLGLKLAAMKMLVTNPDHIEKHYTLDLTWRKVTGDKTIQSYIDKGLKPPSDDPLAITAKILENLKKYMTSGPIIAMVWQGANAVSIVRKITGKTEPLTSDVGTIRGDFVLDSYQMSDEDGRSVRNLIHASGSVKEAEMEIDHWFKPEEIINYRLVQEQIIYDVNLDGILE